MSEGGNIDHSLQGSEFVLVLSVFSHLVNNIFGEYDVDLIRYLFMNSDQHMPKKWLDR